MEPQIFERDGAIYLVAPVAPITPGESELEHFAFADRLKEMAPNENLMWLRGNYVEAENANRNGHVWTAGELSIKSLSPMFMPVTVMHDPRTAVGLIADTALKVPERDDVPRARIETAMGLWQHRFPDVCQEVAHNYEQGSLMQSMECRSPFYTCVACGESFPKLLDGSERKNWCAHMKESDGHGARILGDVTFTGTGLIFGSRGARGAYDEAHLDVFQDEVAEFHQRAQRDSQPAKRRRTFMDPIEISREEYASLQQRPTSEAFAAEKQRADDAETRASEAESKVEETETKLQAEKTRADEAVSKLGGLEEDKAKDELSKERLGKLGAGFLAKLGEFTRDRLNEHARTLSEDDWEARLKELEETTSTARDTKGEGEPTDPPDASAAAGGGGKGPEFSREEVARAHSHSNGNGGTGEEPSSEERQSVMRGLVGPRK